MTIPTTVAVARLANSTRRLFRAARSLAVESGSTELTGFHLFLAATRMDRSRVIRFIPAKPRARLSREAILRGPAGSCKSQFFFPVSPPIKNACQAVAKSARLVLPEALLSRVFGLDPRTRTSLKAVLGDELFDELKDRLILNEFAKDERNQLLRLRHQFLMERDYDNERDKSPS